MDIRRRHRLALPKVLSALTAFAVALASCNNSAPAPDSSDASDTLSSHQPQALFSAGVTRPFTNKGGGFVGVHDFIKRLASAHHFTGFGLVFGDSNEVGIANFNATGQSDTGYGVSDVTGYAPVTMNRHYANAIADPITWLDTGTETLRAYAAPPASNMGQEQTLGRRLYQRGIAKAPIILGYGLSGATQHTHFRTDSVSPITGGNINAQMVAYVKARQIEFGRQLDFAVYVLGENDTSTSLAANATQADMTNIIAGLRNGLGRPTLPVFVILLNSATTGANTATVRSQQVSYVAADTYARGIYVDDITLAANPHYGANGYYDLGDRVADSVGRYFYPTQIFNLGSGSIPWFQDFGAVYTTAVSPATAKPRSGPDVRDGDVQILVATSQATDPTYTLTTAAGFTALGSGKFNSIFSGTNFRTMEVWWRLVDATTLAANNNTMPDPVLDPSTVATTGAVIYTFRGPNKWVANPVDLFVTGANNGNSTNLTIGGGTTAVANELAVVLCSLPGSGSTSTAANSNITSITKQRESIISQASFIGLCLYTGQVANSNTVIGNTTVTMSGAGNNVGALITIKP